MLSASSQNVVISNQKKLNRKEIEWTQMQWQHNHKAVISLAVNVWIQLMASCPWFKILFNSCQEVSNVVVYKKCIETSVTIGFLGPFENAIKCLSICNFTSFRHSIFPCPNDPIIPIVMWALNPLPGPKPSPEGAWLVRSIFYFIIK